MLWQPRLTLTCTTYICERSSSRRVLTLFTDPCQPFRNQTDHPRPRFQNAMVAELPVLPIAHLARRRRGVLGGLLPHVPPATHTEMVVIGCISPYRE